MKVMPDTNTIVSGIVYNKSVDDKRRFVVALEPRCESSYRLNLLRVYWFGEIPSL